MFLAVQDSCNYAGTKLCLNDHYLCEMFCLGWTIHHCNTTPMWGLISLLVLIEHLPQLAWMPTYGTAIRDFRNQFTWSHCYDMSLAVTAPCLGKKGWQATLSPPPPPPQILRPRKIGCPRAPCLTTRATKITKLQSRTCPAGHHNPVT